MHRIAVVGRTVPYLAPPGLYCIVTTYGKNCRKYASNINVCAIINTISRKLKGILIISVGHFCPKYNYVPTVGGGYGPAF